MQPSGNSNVLTAKVAARIERYRAIAESTEANSLSASTLKVYGYKINGLKKWLKANQFFGCFENINTAEERILCPIPEDILRCFFGYLLDEEDDDDDDGGNNNTQNLSQISAAAASGEAEPKKKSARRSSTIEPYSSAITHMYRNYGPPIHS